MIKMHVDSIQLDAGSLQPILVLCDDSRMRALPIWIGSAEATAITRMLMNVESSRPRTHNLLYNTISNLGFTVSAIEINEISEDTFYASIKLSKGTESPVTIDARPSDAVALALIADAPIFVAPHVMAESTYPVDAERDQAEAEAFKDFLEKVKPSDFVKLGAVSAPETAAEKPAESADDERDAA